MDAVLRLWFAAGAMATMRRDRWFVGDGASPDDSMPSRRGRIRRVPWGGGLAQTLDTVRDALVHLEADDACLNTLAGAPVPIKIRSTLGELADQPVLEAFVSAARQVLQEKRTLGRYVRVDISPADAKRVMAKVLGLPQRKLHDLLKWDRLGPRRRSAATARAQFLRRLRRLVRDVGHAPRKRLVRPNKGT